MIQAPSNQSTGARRWLAPLLWMVGLVILMWALYSLYHLVMGAKSAGKPTLKQITMVKIQTPPPPPPKPPEKPPEPPLKLKEEVKLEQPKAAEPPKQAQAQPEPAAAKLGVDAAASGDGDGFGLASNPGGKDYAGPAIGGSGTASGAVAAVTRAQYTFYRDVMIRHLSEVLSKVSDLREQDALIPLAVWLDKNGRIEKVEILDSALSAERIQLVRATLLAGPTVRQIPPDNMPQPLRLKVRIQDAG
jgi:periplasmic protein TonB